MAHDIIIASRNRLESLKLGSYSSSLLEASTNAGGPESVYKDLIELERGEHNPVKKYFFRLVKVQVGREIGPEARLRVYSEMRQNMRA